MTFDPTKPHNDLSLLPPIGEVETRRTLRACTEARAVLGELRGVGKLIPNQAILINGIPTLEAQASSEIENIVTTADRLFRYASEGDANTDPATKETLNYRKALYVGSELLTRRPVSTGMAISMCSIVKGVDMEIRRNCRNRTRKSEDKSNYLHTARRGSAPSRYARELGSLSP